MRIHEYTFSQAASAQIREQVISASSESETLDELIDRWVLKSSGRLSLGVVFSDDNEHLPDMFAIAFDDSAGVEVCCATIERSFLKERYPEVCIYDSYVNDPLATWEKRIVDEVGWNRWRASIGMSQSFALMAAIGPRSAALPYALSFALSYGGIAEIRGVKPGDFSDEDMLEDLEKERLTMTDFFQVQAAYCNPKKPNRGPMWLMDSVYFRRERGGHALCS
jgi:hypothetical protein